MNIKKLLWTETAEILGALGVIGSLIFVAFEIQQNTELLAAEARATRHENRSQNANRQFLENPELVQLVVKANNGASLTQEEQFTIERYFNQILIDFQFVFVEYARGQFDESDLQAPTMKAYFYSQPGLPRYWDERKGVEFRPDFVQWMETNVANR